MLLVQENTPSEWNNIYTVTQLSATRNHQRTKAGFYRSFLSTNYGEFQWYQLLHLLFIHHFHLNVWTIWLKVVTKQVFPDNQERLVVIMVLTWENALML